MHLEIMKKGAAALMLAALAACGGGGGGSTEAQVTGVSSPQLLEGNDGTSRLVFTLSLDRPVQDGVRVTYATASTAKAGGGGTGSATGGGSCAGQADYVSAASSIVLAKGAEDARIAVTVCGDTRFEPSETLALSWDASSGGEGTAVGTILNDEAGGLNGTGVAGSYGRDSSPLTNGDADGRAGFSFAQVPSAADWQCTRDQVTGLLWEGKSNAGSGLHDGTATYTWAQLGAFVDAVNAQALCGFTDWRLPTPEELSSLVDAGAARTPTLDTDWFPNQQAARYWTSTSYRDGVGQDAWFVDFNTGTVAVDNKTRTFHARLVTRGGTAAPAPLAASCSDTRRWVDHGDGTVSDSRTGLMWKKCAEGLTGSACSGTALALEWEEAVDRPAAANADPAGAGLGYTDWRLPSRAELSSIAEREQCFNPAIVEAAFPGTGALGYWSGTPYAFSGSLAWAVDFFDGQVAPGSKAGLGSSSKRVRLVRAGQ